jgi:hypothetical protein
MSQENVDVLAATTVGMGWLVTSRVPVAFAGLVIWLRRSGAPQRRYVETFARRVQSMA